MPSVIFKSFPVTGVEPDGDDLKVVGRCSDGDVDFDGDIVSPAAMASEVKRWLGTYPALRYQHRGDHPAGRGLEAWQDADGSTWLKALVCDSAAVKMVKKQVLRAFSVGLTDVRTQKSSRAPRYEIVGFRLTEVSLVDSPSNARCGIEVCKSAGGQAVYVGRAFGVAKAGKPGKIEKARQRFSGDPEGFYRWLAKRAQANHEESLRAFASAQLGSVDPQARELAREVLGRYGLG